MLNKKTTPAIARRAATGLGTAAVVALAAGVLTGGGLDPAGHVRDDEASLALDTSDYATITVTIDGVETPVRWYQELCYVADPISVPDAPGDNTACGYQSMNVFVPEAVADDPDAAMYLGFDNSGWFASYVRAQLVDGAVYDSAESAAAAALKAGYIYADVATRSRGIAGEEGDWVGKAPAAVVDAKAAVRYLRLNDDVLAGSAERIIAAGTSGGGALVSALGASGNSRDYTPYLAEIGAAGVHSSAQQSISDDVFAVVAYCPITDLGNADAAYEWLYTRFDTRAESGQDPYPDASAALAAEYAAVLDAQKLRGADGKRIDADGMLAEIEAQLVRSAETYMAQGGVIPDLGEEVATGETTLVNDWIDVDADAAEVDAFDLENYLLYVVTTRELKPAPAFDQTGVAEPGAGGGPGSGESNLFGDPDEEYSNFTEYSWNDNAAAGDGIGRDDTGLTWDQLLRDRDTVVDEQVDLVDPMEYIGTNADTASHWYVRHGARDRDTSLTVSTALALALEGDRRVDDVNFQFAWDTGHAGNYDIPEAMAWLEVALAD
ncbi:subtype B tannase [Microbacterium karelineae]|uniref:subtype B tannase n=1 Tax=Microbacterium karelineae TaxID=2654283 RepID=UPI0012E99C56|nr:subtype B tannase [Microbacterium karelineae]